MAERAADLARQLVLDALTRRIVPLQIVVAVREVDVVLVEYGGPLERCGYNVPPPRSATQLLKSGWKEGLRRTMLCLTRRAMAQLAIQGLVSRQLELHFAAMATRLVFDVEVVLRVVHLVRRLSLPVVFLGYRLLELCLCRVHLDSGGGGESTAKYWCSETESSLRGITRRLLEDDLCSRRW